ncbi:Outer membrane protein beta-barrel domain protein [anaerobic digester metagenome]
MVCVSFALLCAATSVVSQQLSWGIVPGFNSATQLVRNPSKPEDGTFQFNSISAWGLDAFAEKQIVNNLNAQIRAGYQHKGMKNQVQTPITTYDNTLWYLEPEGHFHYINLDVIAKWHLNKENINPFFITGIRGNYLISKSNNSTPAFYDGYSTYKNFNIGMLTGIGIEFQNVVSLALETDLDLIRPVKTSSTAVRNLVISGTLGINFGNIFFKS